MATILLVVSYKIKHVITIQPSNGIQTNENMFTQKATHKCLQQIFNTQKLGATQISFSERGIVKWFLTNGSAMVHPLHGTLLSSKKTHYGYNTHNHFNASPRKLCSVKKKKKPIPEGHIV